MLPTYMMEWVLRIGLSLACIAYAAWAVWRIYERERAEKRFHEAIRDVIHGGAVGTNWILSKALKRLGTRDRYLVKASLHQASEVRRVRYRGRVRGYISSQLQRTPVITATDVAALILRECGAMTFPKLHKLLYYCQSWSLVWDGLPLFTERIEAWASGPILPALYLQHKGTIDMATSATFKDARPDAIQGIHLETVRGVLAYYADKEPQWLSDLVCREEPWRIARAGLAPGERGNHEIEPRTMLSYYSSLT